MHNAWPKRNAAQRSSQQFCILSPVYIGLRSPPPSRGPLCGAPSVSEGGYAAREGRRTNTEPPQASAVVSPPGARCSASRGTRACVVARQVTKAANGQQRKKKSDGIPHYPPSTQESDLFLQRFEQRGDDSPSPRRPRPGRLFLFFVCFESSRPKQNITPVLLLGQER